MSQKLENKKYASKKDARLHWFVNKLLLLSKKPVILQNEYDGSMCLKIELLKNEPTLFPHSDKKSEYAYSIEEDYYNDYCLPILEKIKHDTNYLKTKGLVSSHQPEFYWWKDEGPILQYYCVFVSCEYVPLLKIYLKYLIKESKNNHNDSTIQKIEILKDENERESIKVYINGKGENEPLEFTRKGNWELLYKIANKEYLSSGNKKNQNFCTYFNSRKENPLYATHGFKPTKILKIVNSEILPNIEIKLIGKNKRNATA